MVIFVISSSSMPCRRRARRSRAPVHSPSPSSSSSSASSGASTGAAGRTSSAAAPALRSDARGHERLGRLRRELEVVGAARLGIDEDPVGDLDPLAQQLDVADLEHRIARERVFAVGIAGEAVGALDVLERRAARDVEGLVVVLLGERLHAVTPASTPASIRGAISLRAMRAR